MNWLSFGAVTEHPGALRVDVRPVADEVGDIRALRFPPECFEGVECFHVLEHLTPGDAAMALAEVRRVLQPGGVLEIAVPDMEACARTLLAGTVEVLWNIYSPSPEEAQRHRWGYTRATLEAALIAAGFRQISMLPQSPKDPNEIRLRAVK